MNIATVDLKTGNVAMFGLPRNTASTPLGKKTATALGMKTFPDILNACTPPARSIRRSLPDGGEPGAEAVRETASLILGIPIDYYAVVNMMGLVDMVNAFGGVDINLKTALHITYAPLDAGEQKTSYVFNVGVNHLERSRRPWPSRATAPTATTTPAWARQRCVLMGHALSEQRDRA